MKPVVLVAGAAFALAGCATGYQAKSFSGGFSEIRLNETTYKINFAGNGFTSSERAGNIALLRAAELTQHAGFDRFVVVSGGTQQNFAGSTPITTTISGDMIVTTGGNAITKPSSDLVISMLRPADPGYAMALDAKMIAAQLKPQLAPAG